MPFENTASRLRRSWAWSLLLWSSSPGNFSGAPGNITRTGWVVVWHVLFPGCSRSKLGMLGQFERYRGEGVTYIYIYYIIYIYGNITLCTIHLVFPPGVSVFWGAWVDDPNRDQEVSTAPRGLSDRWWLVIMSAMIQAGYGWWAKSEATCHCHAVFSVATPKLTEMIRKFRGATQLDPGISVHIGPCSPHVVRWWAARSMPWVRGKTISGTPWRFRWPLPPSSGPWPSWETSQASLGEWCLIAMGPSPRCAWAPAARLWKIPKSWSFKPLGSRVDHHGMVHNGPRLPLHWLLSHWRCPGQWSWEGAQSPARFSWFPSGRILQCQPPRQYYLYGLLHFLPPKSGRSGWISQGSPGNRRGSMGPFVGSGAARFRHPIRAHRAHHHLLGLCDIGRSLDARRYASHWLAPYSTIVLLITYSFMCSSHLRLIIQLN